MYNLYDSVEMMLVLLKGGGIGKGGMNFDAKTRRNSTDLEDIFIAHISSMDTLAHGLIVADKILKSSDYLKMKKKRYASFQSEKAKSFEKGKLNLDDLAKLAVKNGELKQISGKQELLESMINQYL